MAMRGRGSGRGRGRPRGAKTQIWEWENYKPGPEVYDMICHIRDAPPKITPNLSNECPIRDTPGAQSRILDRRTSDDAYARPYYLVRVRKPRVATDSDKGDEGDERCTEETLEIDWSRILDFVSPREYERYENAVFKDEEEVEAVERRERQREKEQKRLKKNARGRGVGRGSRITSGLEADEQPRRLGRPPKRGYGRGRGRPRGRGGMVHQERAASEDATLSQDELQEAFEDALNMVDEPGLDSEGIETREIPETDEEDEDDKPTSPVMLSSFVANSALPISPVAVHRGHTEVPDIDDESNSDASMSSAAEQLAYERRVHERAMPHSDAEVDEDDVERGRPVKRRKTESVASSRQAILALQRYHGEDMPESSPSSSDHSISDGAVPESPMDVVSSVEKNGQQGNGDEVEDEEGSDAEEYAIEAILDHSYLDDDKYYLVKWEDHGEATDWLHEDDLGGAAEMVADYNVKLEKRRLKGKRAKSRDRSAIA